MTIENIFVLIIISGVHEAFSLMCHNCMSFDKYDANCVVLRGRGRDNEDGYYEKCSELMNACSIYIGKFVHGSGRPETIVWRQCDSLDKGEDECSASPGPDSRVPTLGQTCKCQQDFCNWRLGDVRNYTQGPAAPGSHTTPQPGTANTNSAVANLNLPLHHLVTVLTSFLCTVRSTGWTTHDIKSLQN